MRIPERDVTYIVLSVYLLTLTSPIKHKINHTLVNCGCGCALADHLIIFAMVQALKSVTPNETENSTYCCKTESIYKRDRLNRTFKIVKKGQLS